jgi:hypothetical protein
MGEDSRSRTVKDGVLRIRTPPLDHYVHPHERRRLRRDRLRAMGIDIPWDEKVDGTLAEAFEAAEQ